MPRKKTRWEFGGHTLCKKWQKRHTAMLWWNSEQNVSKQIPTTVELLYWLHKSVPKVKVTFAKRCEKDAGHFNLKSNQIEKEFAWISGIKGRHLRRNCQEHSVFYVTANRSLEKICKYVLSHLDYLTYDLTQIHIQSSSTSRQFERRQMKEQTKQWPASYAATFKLLIVV